MADAIIALTPEEVGYLTAANGVPSSKITVVPVGVNLTRFAPQGPALARNGRLRVVTAGRLVTRKGVDTVINAFARLPRAADAELLIAGGPHRAALQTDPTARHLRSLACRHGVEDRVELLGRMPHGSVPELLRSADVFVCAPHYEPFGTAALEAAACGVPVIASAVGGLREHVRDGVTGVLVPPDDPATLSHALHSLLSNPGSRTRLGAAGAENARSYAWPAIADRILATYRAQLGTA
ncbi:glycosyltransferase [Actinomadura violacea]|uniref:Glycosyltransferase n=1 Tax=Actinomadura violacea TaxID=2819934 RepID=A0ABS3RHZ2_9ACTN|nr:glycosyltransferase [Actinomadura violacea]MBO2456343.1 glycosyltransferase [Actinomadura violacea]